MPLTETTKDRLSALSQLSTSLASVSDAAIAGADSDDPRVDPLMGTVRKIYFALVNLGSEVASVSQGESTVERKSVELLSNEFFVIPSDAPQELSLRQFQNIANEANPSISFAQIEEVFNAA